MKSFREMEPTTNAYNRHKLYNLMTMRQTVMQTRKMVRQINCWQMAKVSSTHLLGLLVASLQVPGPLSAAWHNFLPAVLHAGQEILDEDDVLLLAEVLEVGAHLVQGHHGLPVATDVFLQHLANTANAQVSKGTADKEDVKFWTKVLLRHVP